MEFARSSLAWIRSVASLTPSAGYPHDWGRMQHVLKSCRVCLGALAVWREVIDMHLAEFDGNTLSSGVYDQLIHPRIVASAVAVRAVRGGQGS